VLSVPKLTNGERIEDDQGIEPRDEYVRIRDQLLLFGGRPMGDLAEMVRKSGFEPVTALP
jgi:hypothetical protein